MTEAEDVKVDREPSFTLADGTEYPGTYIYTLYGKIRLLKKQSHSHSVTTRTIHIKVQLRHRLEQQDVTTNP
jgi:hypothetical protein